MAVHTYEAKGLVKIRIRTYQKDVAERRLASIPLAFSQMGVEFEWLTEPELEEVEVED